MAFTTPNQKARQAYGGMTAVGYNQNAPGSWWAPPGSTGGTRYVAGGGGGGFGGGGYGDALGSYIQSLNNQYQNEQNQWGNLQRNLMGMNTQLNEAEQTALQRQLDEQMARDAQLQGIALGNPTVPDARAGKAEAMGIAQRTGQGAVDEAVGARAKLAADAGARTSEIGGRADAFSDEFRRLHGNKADALAETNEAARAQFERTHMSDLRGSFDPNMRSTEQFGQVADYYANRDAPMRLAMKEAEHNARIAGLGGEQYAIDTRRGLTGDEIAGYRGDTGQVLDQIGRSGAMQLGASQQGTANVLGSIGSDRGAQMGAHQYGTGALAGTRAQALEAFTNRGNQSLRDFSDAAVGGIGSIGRDLDFGRAMLPGVSEAAGRGAGGGGFDVVSPSALGYAVPGGEWGMGGGGARLFNNQNVFGSQKRKDDRMLEAIRRVDPGLFG